MTSRSGNVFLLGLVILINYQCLLCYQTGPQGAVTSGVSGNSRSRPFPRMKASDSHSRIMGMDFFIPFPFPNFRNGFSSFSSRSRIMGMGF